MKHIVTSGCSFSDAFVHGRWPQQLTELIKEPHTLYNYGMASKGNDWISKSIIYKVDKLLKEGISTDDIRVVAMWSGLDRKGLWITEHETHNFENLKMIPIHRCQSNPSNFRDESFLPANVPGSTKLYKCEGNGYLAGSFSCTFNDHINDWRQEYNKRFYTHEGAGIEAYEHFLRLQWFLDLHNIKYFFMTYANIMTWPCHITGTVGQLTKDVFPNIEHLYNMVNWDKWVFHNETEGLYEYCLYHGLTLGPDDFHPTEESQIIFTKNFVYPAAQKLLDMM